MIDYATLLLGWFYRDWHQQRYDQQPFGISPTPQAIYDHTRFKGPDIHCYSGMPYNIEPYPNARESAKVFFPEEFSDEPAEL